MKILNSNELNIGPFALDFKELILWKKIKNICESLSKVKIAVLDRLFKTNGSEFKKILNVFVLFKKLVFPLLVFMVTSL